MPSWKSARRAICDGGVQKPWSSGSCDFSDDRKLEIGMDGNESRALASFTLERLS
jgi:hypothetical protein